MIFEEHYLLQNIGIPGLVVLVCILSLLYFLVRNYNKYSIVGEASRTKYISVWFFIGLISNFCVKIWAEVWVNFFPESILSPPENLLLFLCYYAFSLVVIYFIFTVTHSFFTTIIRKKIIPYIWLSGVLGTLISIGQFSAVEISEMYPDFFTYNTSAVVLLQLLYIALVSRWISKNPGFEPAMLERDAVNIHRKEPQITTASVKNDATDSYTNSARIIPDQSKYVVDSGNDIEVANKQEPSKDSNPGKEFPTSDTLPKQKFKDNDFSSESTLGISLNENSEIHRQELCEFLYAASKFGDLEKVLDLLVQLGFQVTRDHIQFKIKDNNGLEKVIDGEENFINFAKRLSMQ